MHWAAWSPWLRMSLDLWEMAVHQTSKEFAGMANRPELIRLETLSEDLFSSSSSSLIEEEGDHHGRSARVHGGTTNKYVRDEEITAFTTTGQLPYYSREGQRENEWTSYRPYSKLAPSKEGAIKAVSSGTRNWQGMGFTGDKSLTGRLNSPFYFTFNPVVIILVLVWLCIFTTLSFTDTCPHTNINTQFVISGLWFIIGTSNVWLLFVIWILFRYLLCCSIQVVDGRGIPC